MNPTASTNASPSPSRGAAANRRRNTYASGERHSSLGRLTTRCPAILRDHLKHVASDPMSGYRSLTHMVTCDLIEFMVTIEANNPPPSFWAHGRAASAGTVLVHANTERHSRGSEMVSGVDLASRALALGESLGVNMSSFTLTLLLWMSDARHPPADAKMKAALVAARDYCFPATEESAAAVSQSTSRPAA